MSVSIPSRPQWLPYRSKDGVFETYFKSDQGVRAFSNFVEQAISWSRSARGDYRLLDSFMSDSLSAGLIQEVLRECSAECDLRILVVDPTSDFAAARASSIKQEVEKESKKGLLCILSALILCRSKGREASAQIARAEGMQNRELLEAIQVRAKESYVKLRFYSTVAGGPLYFFKDIVLSGRFAAGTSAADLPWNLVVNDPGRKDDLYDVLSEEFEHIWGLSYEWPGKGERSGYRVFLSYSEKDRELAEEMALALRSENIFVFLACVDVDAGEVWSDAIRSKLKGCDEVLALLTRNSLGSRWVHAEVGAAWCLGKVITPALGFVEAMELPEYLSSYQGIGVVTVRDRQKLVEAIRNRARKGGKAW